MYQVFISHRTNELGLLQALVRALAGIGVNVYVAERDPWPGRYLYEEKIIPAIKASDCVLVLLTAAGAVSPDVNQEIGIAHASQKPLVPLVERGVQPTGVLAGREVILFDRQNLWDALQKAYRYLADQAASKEQASDQSNQQLLLWMGIGLAALVGIGLAASRKRRKKRS